MRGEAIFMTFFCWGLLCYLPNFGSRLAQGWTHSFVILCLEAHPSWWSKSLHIINHRPMPCKVKIPYLSCVPSMCKTLLPLEQPQPHRPPQDPTPSSSASHWIDYVQASDQALDIIVDQVKSSISRALSSRDKEKQVELLASYITILSKPHPPPAKLVVPHIPNQKNANPPTGICANYMPRSAPCPSLPPR